MKTHTITILPDNRSVSAANGEDLLGALVAAGVYMTAPCGGQGTCGRCLITVRSGNAPAPSGSSLTDAEIAEGIRYACRTEVIDDLTIEIPEGSRLKARALSETNERVTAQRLEIEEDIEERMKGNDPVCRNVYLELDPPSLADPTADLSRLSRAVKASVGADVSHIDFDALKALPSALRADNWRVTATLLDRNAACRVSVLDSSDFEITHIRSGNSGATLALAVDIGTTTVKTQLVDTANRVVLAEESAYNLQINYGEDVISRIIFAGKNDGLTQMRKAVTESINSLLKNLLEKASRDRRDIAGVYACGNTTMTQLFLGVEPRYIREDPYVPAANVFPISKAVDAGLDVPAHAFLYVFPCVSSYIGGDITSGIMAAGVHRSHLLTLYMDIGTNGEIVVGNNDWLMTASCSAGPAFEGGGLHHGMRASEGAIEGFFLNPDTLEPTILVIGRSKPGGAKAKGVCGSGVISILAELLKYGILTRNGKLDTTLNAPRVRKGENGGGEYVLSPASDGADEVILTEGDIDNIIRAKAAMYAGYRILLDHAGLSFGDLDRMVITGSFGSYIDIEKAIVIGLLPELPRDKFFYLPNGALAGVRAGAMSGALLCEAEAVSRMMTNIELGSDPRFMDAYMAAMFLPHTNAGEFPVMTARLDHLNESRINV